MTIDLFSGHIQVIIEHLVFEGSESITLLFPEKWKLYNSPDFMIQPKLREFYGILRGFFFLLWICILSLCILSPITYLFFLVLLISLVWRWGDSASPKFPGSFPQSLCLYQAKFSLLFSLSSPMLFLSTFLCFYIWNTPLKHESLSSYVILIFSVLPIRLFQNDRKISLACSSQLVLQQKQAATANTEKSKREGYVQGAPHFQAKGWWITVCVAHSATTTYCHYFVC